MSRPANVATGRISVGKCRDRQMSRPANVATGKCRDRQMSRSAKVRPAKVRPARCQSADVAQSFKSPSLYCKNTLLLTFFTEGQRLRSFTSSQSSLHWGCYCRHKFIMISANVLLYDFLSSIDFFRGITTHLNDEKMWRLYLNEIALFYFLLYTDRSGPVALPIGAKPN